MKKKITIGILALMLCSCGARKVQKSKESTETKTEQTVITKNDMSVNTNVKVETNTKTIDSTKEEIEETIIEPIDKYKPTIYEGKSIDNGRIIKRKIKRNKAITTDNNINTSLNEKSTDKTTTDAKTQEQSKKNVQAKDVAQESLIKWWWFPLILFVLFVSYKIYRKFTV